MKHIIPNLLSGAILILFIAEIAWPFRIAAILQALVGCEEVLITVKLSEPRDNLQSFWHVNMIRDHRIERN
jgi:hypothetical protein